jgi:hypothetical protein
VDVYFYLIEEISTRFRVACIVIAFSLLITMQCVKYSTQFVALLAGSFEVDKIKCIHREVRRKILLIAML